IHRKQIDFLAKCLERLIFSFSSAWQDRLNQRTGSNLARDAVFVLSKWLSESNRHRNHIVHLMEYIRYQLQQKNSRKRTTRTHAPVHAAAPVAPSLPRAERPLR